MVNFIHYGLYFTQMQVDAAKEYASHEPFQSAWKMLHDQPPPDGLALVQWNALRYRFDGDLTAGEQAVISLQNGLIGVLGEHTSYLDALFTTSAQAQCFELVRDHPAYATQGVWLDSFSEKVNILNAQQNHALKHHEHLWLGVLNLIAGIVLEDERRFTDGVNIYRTVIDQDVRPAGHIPQVVEVESGGRRDGGSLERTLVSIQGLVLMAEAARHIGIDLWSYNNRGVSLVTAALYPLYYYFYPEKWKWDVNIDPETSKAQFAHYGSYLEPLNLRIQQRTKAIDLILKELRPVYSVWGGGLVTLSHGVAARRGLFR